MVLDVSYSRVLGQRLVVHYISMYADTYKSILNSDYTIVNKLSVYPVDPLICYALCMRFAEVFSVFFYDNQWN